MDALQREFFHAMFPDVIIGLKQGILSAKYVGFKTTKAKKQHRCGACYQPILIGERYTTLNMGDGPAPSVARWRSFKLCMPCEIQVFNLLRVKEGHV